MLRASALAIPHFDSDEPAYEGLAESLLHGNGYTVRHVGLEVVEAQDGVALIRLGRDAREHGAVLDFYAPEHQDAMDGQAISPRSPLFPALLAASVAALGSGHVEVVAATSEALARRSRAEVYAGMAESSHRSWMRAQLPLVLVPLGASLIAVALAAFGVGASPVASLVAGLAVAAAPLDVWCAHRVTADTLTEALVGAAALLLARSVGRSGGVLLAALAGAISGLAVLSKSSSILLAPACLAAESAFALRDRDFQPAARRVGAFGAALALTGLVWPLYRAFHGGGLAAALGYGGVGLPAEALAGSWPQFALSRPFWTATVSTAILSPLLGVGLVGLIVAAMRELRPVIRATGGSTAVTNAERMRLLPVALVALAFVVATAIWPARENRFLLPAYVPLAVGLAWTIDRVLARARGVATFVVLALVAATAIAVPAWIERREVRSGAYELTPVGPRYGA